MSGVSGTLLQPQLVRRAGLYGEAPSYEAQVVAQNAQARAKGPGDIDKLMRAGNTWAVT